MPKARGSRLPKFQRLIRPVALGLLLAGVFSLVWIRTRVMEVRYELGGLERARAELVMEQKKLIDEKTRFAAPARIAMRAARLGLSVPDRRRVYLVRYEPRVVRVNSPGSQAVRAPGL